MFLVEGFCEHRNSSIGEGNQVDKITESMSFRASCGARSLITLSKLCKCVCVRVCVLILIEHKCKSSALFIRVNISELGI